MNVREVITYLLNFNMSSNVVFVDKNGEINEITDDNKNNYLGNGTHNLNSKEVRFISSITHKQELTAKDFKLHEAVKVVDENSDIKGYVGTVLGISKQDGGKVLFTPPDTVTVLFHEGNKRETKSFSETLSIHAVVKISTYEYENTLDKASHKVYFISGHRDITHNEFYQYYLPILVKLVADPHCDFVVGDCQGVDRMAQKALKELGVGPQRVTVYHMSDKPRELADSEFKVKGGYASDEERDTAMTHDSTDDVAWIRKGKEKSGTAQNILRRYTMYNNQ